MEPPAPQSVSSAAPLLPPAPTANQPEPATPDLSRYPQPVPGSEAVRQLLQDEMFRLLQLQQINFMSLMQVVGSSFAAVPALQHVLEQTSQMGRNPVLNPAGDHSAPQTDAKRRDPGVTEENHQRLKANIILSAGDSIKRKNRRTLKEKNEKKEKKVSVSFRPDDSIIASNNLDEVTRPEIAHRDKPDPEGGNDFVIPLGSFESMLSHEIPETPISSMAELHFLASTMKRPPDIRDASTNTDSEVLPPDVQQQMPPELFLNLPQPHDGQLEKPRSRIVHYGDVGEFPERFADFTDPDVPSSAELHHLAASVRHHHLPEGPQLGDRGPGAVDGVSHHVLSADLIFAPSSELAPLTVRTPCVKRNEAVSKLKEMDVQLQALQNMADGMEKDFANTRLLVKTLETLTSAAEPEPIDVPPRRAGAPQRVFSLRDDPLGDLKEEEAYNRTGPAGIGSRERPLEDLIFSSGDGDLTTALGRSEETDPSVFQDALQMSGLSDIADILGDLMAGGVSASDLGLTPAQADNLSRVKPPGTSRRTPRERADLLRWMKKKQRERLADHRRRLRELREKEHKPFQSLQTPNTSKAIREMQQVKDERERTLLLEHHGHRVSDAIDLMQEMLSEAKQIPSARSQPSAPRAAPLRHSVSPKGNRDLCASEEQLGTQTPDAQRPQLLRPQEIR
ncbi:unnamed protein product [Ranitomeya imitator]|uniref:Uncharacterized protein n=1 Tax=Ranitomeya imitator TaxID=111125 RepID=A0ABN9LWU7_9NEOB|nr:unnamed protein product [Ranitomeya imitator]